MLEPSCDMARISAQIAQEFGVPKERVKDYAISIVTGNESGVHVWYGYVTYKCNRK
jgi:hypothetical protein